MVLLFSDRAIAEMSHMTARISFDQPLSWSKTSDIRFGALKPGATYTLAPSGVVTSSDASARVSSAATVGSMVISSPASQSINISAGEYTSNDGVALQKATCAYDGVVVDGCSVNNARASGAGKVLLLGVQAVVDATRVARASATHSFTIIVAYQ